jgi:hypothetical protein
VAAVRDASATAAENESMGSAFSTGSAFPTSTSSLCVLPLRTNGQNYFSIAHGPMPAPLGMRLTEAEYQGVVAGINTVVQPLSGFGVLSLLLPFLVVDILTLLLLSTLDPWLILSPWDYPLVELLLPLGIEFGVIFCSFPLMALAVNRRMADVQRRVRDLLDDASRRFGPRGLSFQLKQGVLNNGAGTNLWVEVQVVPLIHVQTPVPVPVPAVCPVLLPSTAQPPPPPSPEPAERPPSAAHPDTDASAATSASSSASVERMAAEASVSAAGASLSAQQVEYLRVLQENQLLRQYLAQSQALLQHLVQQQQQPQQPRFSPQQEPGAAVGPTTHAPPPAATALPAAA